MKEEEEEEALAALFAAEVAADRRINVNIWRVEQLDGLLSLLVLYQKGASVWAMEFRAEQKNQKCLKQVAKRFVHNGNSILIDVNNNNKVPKRSKNSKTKR